MKKKLKARKDTWAEELYRVLWAHRMTKRTPTGESPFAISHGVETMILTEIIVPTIKMQMVDQAVNDKILVLCEDLTE